MALGTWNPDAIADSDLLNKGIYQARLASWKEKETSNGKLMLSFRWVIEAPEQFAKVSLFENLVVGSDDHPDSIDPSAFGTRTLKQTVKVCHVQPDPDVETTLNRMLETSCLLAVEQETYQDRLQNKITARYSIGDREPMVTGTPTAATAPQTPLAGRPSTRRAAKAAE